MVNRANEMARFIRVKRQNLKLSQNDLSYILGLEQSKGQFISNIERGVCQFPINHIKKLSEVLKVSPETIVEIMAKDYKQSVLKYLDSNITNE